MGATRSGASFSAMARAQSSFTSRFLLGSSGRSFSAALMGNSPTSRSPSSSSSTFPSMFRTVAYRITGLVNAKGVTVDELLPPKCLARPEAILMTAIHSGNSADAHANGGEDRDNDHEKRKVISSRSVQVMEALARYIPVAAQKSMATIASVGRSHQWLGEIRRCSIVFVNFTGIDYTGEGTVSHVQKAMLIMQRVIHQYGGSLRQFLVEDKGSTLIAAFGLPGSTHEDDSWRAIMTAWSISKRMTEAELPNKIGVTTGDAFCGNIGSHKRCEYALYGDVAGTPYTPFTPHA